MKPDVDLQLQVIIRSLSEVILPAINPEDKPANEQIHLCIHNLNIAKSRIPFMRRFVRSEIRDSVALLSRIDEILDGSDRHVADVIKQATAEAERNLRDPDIDTEELVSEASALHSVVSELLQGLAGHPAYFQVERMGVEFSKNQLDKARAWFVNCGMESDPAQVPNLADVV